MAIVQKWVSYSQRYLPPSCYDGDGSVYHLSVKRVGLYCEKMVAVSALSTNCFVVVC